MKNKIKIVIVMAVCSVVLAGYFLWSEYCSVKIVSVHGAGNFSDVLVKNFPITDRGKIDWWLKNKDALKQKYDIPKPASYDNYTVSIWLFGEGYKEDDGYDRLCFSDMAPPLNCIEKDRVFIISYSKNSGLTFTVEDGEYRMKDSGEIIKEKR
ncbi:DUF943 family protein [Pantoea sp.]|uniref:DUF943 family protein n=1 Tax=Pantoea sp. TaxID=69393 RepID=UPI0028ACAEE2|nr:DUF943 family protein [Pantoea sp.]